MVTGADDEDAARRRVGDEPGLDADAVAGRTRAAEDHIDTDGGRGGRHGGVRLL